MNSVYGFKDDESQYDDDDDDGINRETAQKDHRTLNRLKREVGEYKEETQNNIIDLRSTLIINDLLASENLIVVEVSKWTAINNVAPGPITPLFEVFDKIKKLNGNLFHFGECTTVAHDSKDKVIYLLRDSTIYLRVQLALLGGLEDVMFYLTKNHDTTLTNAVLVAPVTPVLNETRLIRLHGRSSIKSSEDLTLHVFSTGSFSLQIMDKSVFHNVSSLTVKQSLTLLSTKCGQA